MRRAPSPRRAIAGDLRYAGIGEDEREALRPAIEGRAEESAFAFARRRRIGPYAAVAPDRAGRDKALGQLLRAGHALDLARRIVAMMPGEQPEGGDDRFAPPVFKDGTT